MRIVNRHAERLRAAETGAEQHELLHAVDAEQVLGNRPFAAIRARRIHVIDGNVHPITGFTRHGVRLGHRDEAFGTVLFCTGYEPRLEEFLAEPEMLAPVRWWRSAPLTDGRSRSRVYPSAFFPGFDVSVNGGHSLGLWGWEAGESIAAALHASPMSGAGAHVA